MMMRRERLYRRGREDKEDITMKGNIDLQEVAKLLRKQQQQNQKIEGEIHVS